MMSGGAQDRPAITFGPAADVTVARSRMRRVFAHFEPRPSQSWRAIRLFSGSVKYVDEQRAGLQSAFDLSDRIKPCHFRFKGKIGIVVVCGGTRKHPVCQGLQFNAGGRAGIKKLPCDVAGHSACHIGKGLDLTFRCGCARQHGQRKKHSLHLQSPVLRNSRHHRRRLQGCQYPGSAGTGAFRAGLGHALRRRGRPGGVL